MRSSSFGVLPDWKIHELYDTSCLWSESKPEIRSAETELTVSKTVSKKGKTIIIPIGETATFELGQRIRKYPPGLGGLYPVCSGKSSVAKAFADVMVLGEDNLPPCQGYRGKLYATVTARGNRPVEVVPGEPLANMRLYVGSPKECILDPIIVAGGNHNVVRGEELRIEGKKLLLRYGLHNGNGPIGYRQLPGDKAVRLVRKANKRSEFFAPVGSCGEYEGKAGDCLLFRTWSKVYIDPKTTTPFVASMLRENMNGMTVNLAKFINYGSGPHNTVMEIPLEKDYIFLDKKYGCYITFSQMWDKPKQTYNGSGSRNNNTITGTFFY
jgi:hypothetical protein